MPAVQRDLVIEQGTSWSSGWTIRTGGQPLFDHTCTVKAQVRERVEAAAVLHEWSTAANNATVSDQGALLLSVQPDESAAWSWRSGVYDVEVTKGGVVYRAVEGSVTVIPEVTR